jgi:(p)ppGpp synthase/HD superfamily hydrolase
VTLKEVKIGNFLFYTNRPIADISFNYCCHPKFGDRIIALITPEKKVVEIHQFFCREAEKVLEKGVYVEWSEERENRYFIVVNLPNRRGELAKFINFITRLGAFINSVQLSEETNNCRMEITLDRKKAEKVRDQLAQNYRLIEFTSKKDAYNG